MTTYCCFRVGKFVSDALELRRCSHLSVVMGKCCSMQLRSKSIHGRARLPCVAFPL